MRNLKLMIQTSLLSLLVVLYSCAKEPNTVIDPLSLTGGLAGFTGEVVKMKALVFTGVDLQSNECKLALTLEEDHKNEKNSVLARLLYSLHGNTLGSMELSNYYFQPRTKEFRETSQGDDVPALAGAIVDSIENPDLNQIPLYRKDGLLDYFLNIQLLSTSDTDAFISALDQVIDDETTLQANREILNVLNRLTFTVKHVGHYDSNFCEYFEVSGVEMVEFSNDDDGHDHDHDHDHE